MTTIIKQYMHMNLIINRSTIIQGFTGRDILRQIRIKCQSGPVIFVNLLPMGHILFWRIGSRNINKKLWKTTAVRNFLEGCTSCLACWFIDQTSYRAPAVARCKVPNWDFIALMWAIYVAMKEKLTEVTIAYYLASKITLYKKIQSLIV